MVGAAAAEVSFDKAGELVGACAGVRVETKQVERTAEALGRRVAADERTVTGPAPAPAPTMYLGLDGTGVPVRPSEVEGRPGKQPDGSARTREVKLVTVWTAESRDKRGRPVRDPGSVSYNAAVESAAGRDTDPRPSPFAQRVYREAQRSRTTLVLLAVLAAARADAQTVEPRTAASFERLGLLLDQGERIRVTDGAGRELQGRLIDLSLSTLSLRIADVRHDLQEADVAVIRRRQRRRSYGVNRSSPG